MSQVRKNLFGLALLILVGAGIALYAYFGVQKGDETAAKQKELGEKLFAAHSLEEKAEDGGAPAEPKFIALEITSHGETTRLERPDAGDWQLTFPIRATADKFTVDQILSQLQTAKFKSKVEEKPTEADLEKFGLKAPKFSLTATAYVPDAQGGGKDVPARRRQVAFEGGIENPFDGSVYLRKKGEPTVYAAEGGLRIAFARSTFDLREKEVLGLLEEPKLTRIEVKGANAYLLERDPNKAWRMLKPQALPADGTAISTLISSLRSERAVGFPPNTAEERARVGLERPVSEATFTYENGETVHARLSHLKLADGTDKYYLLREGRGDPVLAEVSASMRQFDRPAAELRDKTVLKFNKDQVARVRFSPSAGGPPIVVARSFASDGGVTDEWAVVEPQRGPAKKWKLSSTLWALGALKAAQFGDEHPKDWSKYGLDAKARTVTLEDARGGVLATLSIGKEVPQQANMAYVRGSADQVLEVDTGRFSELPASLSDVLDVSPTPDAGSRAAN